MSTVHAALKDLGIQAVNSGGSTGKHWWSDHATGSLIQSVNPATGEPIAAVRSCSAIDYEHIATQARDVFATWRMVPAPKRGELVRLIGHALRSKKDQLGTLVSLEVGKIKAEGDGEVQEMIDMADFCVGLSRQLYGLSMHSERPLHRMYEQWHPLGPVGVITAFNFPVAVWAWSAMIAAVCGDSTLWKPSEHATLCSIAVTRIAQRVLEANGAPPIWNLAVGDRHIVGQPLSADARFPLISATGSVAMGRSIGKVVADRLGRALLELGGNNGIIVTADADLDLALRAVLFASVGTAGQRCTTTRRLFLHKSIAAEMKQKLVKAFGSVRIGDPTEPSTLMGPLIHEKAVADYKHALEKAKEQGGRILFGGKVLDRPGFYVEPTLVEAVPHMPITCEETFAPILYLFEFDSMEEAIELHNAVPQGLSSAIFTLNMRSAEQFLSVNGSDCGIANVNIGTSGAEIGGAFGG